jgi:hypothetical protein
MTDLTREEIEEIRDYGSIVVRKASGYHVAEISIRPTKRHALCDLALRGLDSKEIEEMDQAWGESWRDEYQETFAKLATAEARVKELEEEVQAHKVAIRSAIDIGEQDCEQAEARVKELEDTLVQINFLVDRMKPKEAEDG